MRMKLSTGREGDIEGPAVEKLKASLRGELIVAGTAGYDEARRGFNHAIDRKPALIARCKTLADIVNAVQFAREKGVLVSVKGGGHDIAGTSVCDLGLVLDLSRLTAVHVSKGKKSAIVEAGATWGDVDRETHVFGLATTGGTITKVGVAGFTLGGGIGWLARSYGLACDNLLSVDVVTAEGKLVTANASENGDLFWALRGGGGNFGIVASFEFQLHDVKPLFGGLTVYPIKQGRDVLEAYRTLTTGAPDRLCAYATLVVHPQAGPVIAVAGCYNGNAVDGQALFAPLRAMKPIVDAFRPMTYLELQGMLDPMTPSGFHHAWRSSYAQSISDKGIATLLEHFGKVPGAGCQILIEQLGGAIERAGREDSAYSHRDARYSLLIMGGAPDAASHKPAAAWAHACWEAMRPMTSDAVYLNYLSYDEDRLRSAYDANTLKRLAAIKHKYDPTNFLRHNHNVRPLDAATSSSESSSAGNGTEADVAGLRATIEALSARIDGLEDRVMELEFENTLSDKPKQKKPAE